MVKGSRKRGHVTTTCLETPVTTTEETAQATAIDPGPLIKLSIADCAARALHSALALGVFASLADGPATRALIAERVGLHSRMAADFLDTLAALGLLDRVDEQTYANSPLAQAYLVPDTPSYLGGFFELTEQTLYDTWGRLTVALRTGEAARLDPDKGGFVGGAHEDPARMRRFLTGLDAFSDRMGAELARGFDWSGHKSFTDLGGARGNLAAALVTAHPHLAATCFDRERTRPLFDDHMARRGLADRVSFVGGDFFADPIPPSDVVILGHVLHGFDDDARRVLLGRVFDSVRPGGVVMIYDRMIDDDRADLDRLLSSLHMRLVSPQGGEYRVADCRAWVKAAGFAQSTAQPLLGTHTLVVGRR